jgi:23S rRNA G2069 N7-methylase RlmK/C1962 C5-methylase RlmI
MGSGDDRYSPNFSFQYRHAAFHDISGDEDHRMDRKQYPDFADTAQYINIFCYTCTFAWYRFIFAVWMI